ncbi:MAG: caspase family protein [Pseudomonadota bacterium]
MPAKHALIVGINKYPYMGADFQLRGCVNDAKLLRNTLLYKFNFDRAQITELHDEAATRDGILAAMNALYRRVKKDDIVVFHYSGHGHRCTSKTKFTDEGSGKDNCLLPHDDSKPKADGKPDYREIRDDKINAWLQKMATKTANITLIFDACHSGTMTRGVKPEAKARSVPETKRRQPAPTRRTQVSSKPPRRGAGGWLTLNKNYVVISGCRDTQTSKERWFKERDTLYRHGVLTYCLIKAIDKAKPGTTYRDLFESICSSVPASAANQNPQIEGRIDRALFGVKDIEPLSYLPVTAVTGKKLTIDGGAAHGLERGSKWQIYPAATKTTEGVAALDTATIVKVGATTSGAELVRANKKVTTGCRAVVKDARIRTPLLQVFVDNKLGNKARALRTRINQSKLLKLALSKRMADVEATIVARNSRAAKNLQTDLGERGAVLAQSDCWAFTYDDGDLAFAPHSVTSRSVEHILTENLEKIARYRRILALQNPRAKVDVSFNLYTRSATDKLSNANGGSTEFDEGDSIVLEITNNESDRSVFFSLVWLSGDMAIDHFYPPRKNSEELAAGKTIRIGHGKRHLRAALSKNVIGDVAMETCKLMVTTQQSDFSWLNQAGTRSINQASSTVAEFDVAFRGGGSEKSVKPKDDWNALNRSMMIRRRKKTSSNSA